MGWTEKYQVLANPSSPFTYEARNLYSLYGIPKGSVVLMAFMNNESNSDNSLGARQYGSGLGRVLQLQEAEAGGAQVVTYFCQTDPDGIIEIYTGDVNNTAIAVIGYLTGCTYTEISPLNIGVTSDGTWRETGDPIFEDRVVDVLLGTTEEDNELWVGVRESGSALERKFQLMEREAAGTNYLGTLLVQADEDGNFEAFEDDLEPGAILFALGYFSANVSFTEAFLDEDVGDQVPWGDETVSAPADSLANFIITNCYPVGERWGGIRENGSAIGRAFQIRETEGMGLAGFGDLVNVDGSQIIENYIEQGAVVDLWYVGYLTIALVGWAHKFLGISPDNIAKIMGVPRANIVKVMGVE